MYKYVNVVFNKNSSYAKEYCYKTFINEVEPGDTLLVEVNESFAIAYATKISDIPLCNIDEKEIKFVVQKVDFDKFNEEKEKVKRKEELLERMEQKAIKLRNLDFYKLISQTDEEMKQLLDEYKSL